MTDPKKRKRDRRSISVSGLVYQRLHDYAQSEGRPVSAICEELIDGKLGAAGVPVPEKLRPRVSKERDAGIEEEIAEHFTF